MQRKTKKSSKQYFYSRKTDGEITVFRKGSPVYIARNWGDAHEYIKTQLDRKSKGAMKRYDYTNIARPE